jgi:adhesin transport system outer membrane protein
MTRQFRAYLLATVAASTGLLLTGLAGSAGAMSLKDAVNLAVTANPEVGVVSNDRRAIDQELRQGRALYYPQVDVRGATGVEYSDNVTTQEAEEDGDRTLWRKEGSLTISQLLFDGFFADSEVERQASRVKSAAFRVLESAEFVGLDAIEAYLEVQRHRERVVNAEGNVATHAARLGQVEQRAQAGGGNIADVRQAEARLANAESALIQTEGNLRDAEAFFIRVVGQAPDSLEDVAFPGEFMPADIDQAVQAAIESSPTVLFARQDIKTAEAEVKQQEASLYPDFRLELGASIGDDVDGRTVTEYDAQAMVVMRYNLYRGGADTARIREFKWRQAEAIDQMRQFEREAAENARVSWNAVEVSRGNVAILEREVQANINTVEVYKQQFEIGQRGLLDLLDADNELYLAQDSLITARYAETFANFRLLATQGALQKSLGVTPPDAATIYQNN